ncbi:MAG TPA: hypothetical protein VJN42_10545 [Candidatus Acidoferrum sp.]|nr:hypothetical protein [Candidatus Acidoferrum sp.]
MQRILGVVLSVLAGIAALNWHAETRASSPYAKAPVSVSQPEANAADLPSRWDAKMAAAYLDERAAWWMSWPRAARDHGTFCISCHTAVPYAMARSALRPALGEQGPSATERRILENVTKRVRLWKDVEPFYSDKDRGAYKTVESRGTESVLNALILASRDADAGRLSGDALAAFGNMWAEQQTSGEQKGAWRWLRFKNEPWEADDSDFYGAALAAIAAATAPENYRMRPEIQANLQSLRVYLVERGAAQTLSNRVVLLWAAAKWPGLLSAEQQKAIVDEVLDKQQPDGGWSLASLSGNWKRHDGTPQDAQSDGYATGLITFVLQQRDVSPDTAQLKRGLAWLASHQNQSGGFWPAYSLNNNAANHISPDTARFMNDAATAYAVLALRDSAGK